VRIFALQLQKTAAVDSKKTIKNPNSKTTVKTPWGFLSALLLLMAFQPAAQATKFYLTPGGAANAQFPASWNTKQNGSGTAAKKFTNKGDEFVIPSGINGVLTGDWVFGPTSASHNAEMELSISGSLTVNKGKKITLQQWNNGEVEMEIKDGGLIRFMDTSGAQLIGASYANGKASNIEFKVNSGGQVETSNKYGICGTNKQSILNSSITCSFTKSNDFIFTNNEEAEVTVAWLPDTIRSLVVSGTGQTTIANDINISGALVIDSGAVLDLQDNMLTGSNITTTGSGTIRTSRKDSLSLPKGRTWSCKVEYTATDSQDVVDGTYNELILASGKKKLNGSISVEGELKLQDTKLEIGSNTLRLKGKFSGSRTNCLVGSRHSDIVVEGTGPLGDSLFFDASADTGINNLTINRSGEQVHLGNKTKVYGTITAASGSLVASGNLVIVSDAAGTGRIGEGAGSITGNVTVQRYVPACQRRWRFLAAPVNNATLADLKNEIQITGSGGINNGFDASGSNAASVYWYDETMITGDMNTGWKAANNINNPIKAGLGYRIFIRGSRDAGRLNGTLNTQDAVTLDFNGTVNSGDIDMKPTYTVSGNSANDGWNLMGNPYASPIDWNKFYDDAADYTNLSPIIYVYNANSNSYVAYNALSNSGTLNGGIIPSGAAFYVKAWSQATMVMKEKYKVGSNPTALFKTGEYADRDFRIRMTMDTINQDEMVLKYIDDATPAKDAYDIDKMWGAEVNIATLGSDKSYLALNAKPFRGEGDTVKLSVWARSTGNYTMSFVNAADFASNLPLYLLDYYNGNIIDLRNDTSYTFKVTMTDASSFGDSRFELIVGKMPVVIMPTAVNEASALSQTISLYPFNVQQQVTISGLKSGITFMEIRDINGRIMMETAATANQEGQLELNLVNMPAAIYFLWIQQGEGGKPEVLRFVKE
jgi:hypothetical protein